MFDSKRMSKYIRMKIKIEFTKHCTGDPGDFMKTVEIRGKFGDAHDLHARLDRPQIFL